MREVSTSLINSLSLARNHWARKGPLMAERKVRGGPEGFKLRTGAEEGETDGEDEARVGGNNLAVKGLGESKGER